MRVLLIMPAALDQQGRPVKLKKLYLPATTMAMLAAVTPPDVEVKVIYETIEDIPWDEHWDLVGVTGMGSGTVRAWQIGDAFRAKGVKVVIGRVGPTLCDPSWSLAHADCLVLGEAEDLWPGLIEDARQGKLKQVYKMDKAPDMATLPTPRYDVMNVKRFGFFRSVQATRGCPFPCEFCSVQTFFKRTYRKRPVEKVIEDIRAAKATGSRFICFLDDNIGVDFKYCAKLWEALIPENIIWISQCSLHIAQRPDLLDLAYRSGCRLLAFGLESLNEGSLSNISKTFNRPRQYAEAFKTIRKHGIEISISMIMGLDDDDHPQTFQNTYEFITENRVKIPRVHLLTPTPGTKLYDDLNADGRILTQDLQRFTGGQVVFQPKNMSASELEGHYWKLYDNLFSWRNIYKRSRPNPARLSPFFYGALFTINLNYRMNIRNRVIPGNT